MLLDMSNYCVDLALDALVPWRPAAVPSRPRHEPAICDIRFTRRIARQCSRSGVEVPEWAVCDAIANGARTDTGRRGSLGGPVVRFERTYPLNLRGLAPAGAFRGRVVVLGELFRRGCFALQLLSPARAREEIREDLGFLNRAGTKMNASTASSPKAMSKAARRQSRLEDRSPIARRPCQGEEHRARALRDLEGVRRGLDHAPRHERQDEGGDALHRLARGRPRPRRRRPAARAHRGDLRAGVLGKDHVLPERDRGVPAQGRPRGLHRRRACARPEVRPRRRREAG